MKQAYPIILTPAWLVQRLFVVINVAIPQIFVASFVKTGYTVIMR